MGRLRLFPYTTVDPLNTKAVAFKPWSRDGEIESQVSAESRTYDPALASCFERRLDIDAGLFAVEAGQGAAAEFRVLVEAWSRHTNLRNNYVVVDFSSSDGRISEEFGVEFDNSESGGRLQLRTRFVLLRPDPLDELAASVPGSIVCEEDYQHDLEDHFDGFPHVEPADLEGYLGMRPGPVWIVEVDKSDLIVDATQAVTVTVNENCRLGKELIAGSPESSLAHTAMMQEICRAIVNAALDSEEFQREYDSTGDLFSAHPRSIGRTMASTLALCGFHESPGECRTLRQERPHEFDARINNHAYFVGTGV